MDWRAGHLTTTEGMGAGHLPTKIACRVEHLKKILKCPGGGMLATGIDSNINLILKVSKVILKLVNQRK